MVSLFVCPVCASALTREDKAYSCPQGHGFDLAADGYVHLLLSNQKHSANPGDDKGMVRSRADFLYRGYYRMLKDRLASLCREWLCDGGTVLDTGCGVGYYAGGVKEALDGWGTRANVAGVDIAKPAVRIAAKRSPAVEYAVASSYALPVAPESMEVVWSCFSPLAFAEFFRVLTPGGRLVVVQPTPRHLWGLKTILYDQPYENAVNDYTPDGFAARERLEITDTIAIPSGTDVMNLFRMTPYYWKTSVDGAARLERAGGIETEIGFVIDVFRR